MNSTAGNIPPNLLCHKTYIMGVVRPDAENKGSDQRSPACEPGNMIEDIGLIRVHVVHEHAAGGLSHSIVSLHNRSVQ